MKSLTKILFVNTLIGCFYFAPAPISAQGCFPIAGEDATVDLTPHRLSAPDAIQAIADFQDGVEEKTTGDKFAKRVDEIELTDFCKLRTDASTLTPGSTSSMTCPAGQNCARFLTGVKMIFGMDTNANKIALFYQPMKLCFTHTRTIQSCTVNVYCIVLSNNIYYYDNGEFKLVPSVPANIVKNSVDTYKGKLRIGRTSLTTKVPFTQGANGEDEAGDTEAVMFTFKEIEKVCQFNPGADKIRIWNYLRNVLVDGELQNRHSLSLSSEFSNGTSTIFNEIFMSSEFGSFGKLAVQTLYSDLAHMCPPNCSTIQYRSKCDN